jgi:hypothetical protein
MAVAFALGSALTALVVLRGFLRDNSPYWWLSWPRVEGFAMLLAALICSVLPYVLVLWNLRRGPGTGKGLFQALTVASFWFLLGSLLLIGLVFEQLMMSPAELGSTNDMFETAVTAAVLFTLPGLVLLTAGFKASRSLSPSVIATEPSQRYGYVLDRLAVGSTVVLLALPVLAAPFAVGPSLHAVRTTVLEALLMVGLLPYVFVFQRLRQREVEPEALNLGHSLAIGCVTCCVLGVTVWTLGANEYPPLRSRYGWAELAFLALLAAANLLVLGNTFRLKRSDFTQPSTLRSWLSILVVSGSLIVFPLVLCFFALAE